MTISVNGEAKVNVQDLAVELVMSIEKIHHEVPEKLIAITRYFPLQRCLARSNTSTNSRDKNEHVSTHQAILSNTIFVHSYIVCLVAKFRMSEFP
jgi:hypothetical protein